MYEHLTHLFKGFSKEWLTVILAALPMSELKGSIPVALMIGVSPIKALLLSILGNSLPIMPVLFILEPVSNGLIRFKPWRRLVDWLLAKARVRRSLIQRYGAIGLMVFVAAPFPMTGVWSGCIIASLFRIKFRYAFPAIFLGVIEGGIMILSVCRG